MNSSSVPALALQPRSARRASWRRRIWRGEATTSAPSSHATSARHITVPSCQGTGRSVPRSGHQQHVAVAALPRGHRIALDRAHVHVDGEQVVAALGAVLGHLVQEVASPSGACPAAAPACRSWRAARCRPHRGRPPLRARRVARGLKVLHTGRTSERSRAVRRAGIMPRWLRILPSTSTSVSSTSCV